MKKYLILMLCMVTISIFMSSCEKYLDKAPEANFTSEDVYSSYQNFRLFFDAIYRRGTGAIVGADYSEDDNIFIASNLYDAGHAGYKYSIDQMTDLSDIGRIKGAHTQRQGSMATPWYSNRIKVQYRNIRICNIALHLDFKVWKDAGQDEINDIIAQAHFCRAFAYWDLFRFWGGQPYLTDVVGPYDEWDIPRLSNHETLMRISADMDSAAIFFEKAKKMRRDNPVAGGVGNLNSPDQFRPTGVAARAIKGRALLFAASPLINKQGKTDWENAAKANWEAIQIAEQFGYTLLSAANYKQNFVGAEYTNEMLWGFPVGKWGNTGNMVGWLMPGPFGKDNFVSADCPTQNTVDKFETKWGDPLNTQADRDAATALGHYNEQDPYKNRDPRFDIDIIYNQAAIPGFTTAQIWFQIVAGKTTYSELIATTYQGFTRTGYYSRKYWGGQSYYNKTPVQMTDPIIRLTELYLNYAEAANEAYGPNTAAPGSTLTAIQAINVVRQRIGQAPVLPQFTVSTEAFRPRIKNERTIELMSENHYYFDIRRWKDAPTVMAGPLMGMTVEKVAVSPTYPIGYKHTRAPLEAARQTAWFEKMWWFPLPSADYYKFKNYDTSLNPRW